ncbi:MAG: cell division protein FtsA [Treponema sp.]|nr:cell division protein FtsA [Treponema sp.]
MNGERTIVGLDIGTNVIRVAIATVSDDDKLEIVATSTHKSAGLRNGVIVNIEEAKDAVKNAIEEAEQSAGVIVNSVIAGIGGTYIDYENARGVTPIRANPKSNRREVTQEDISKVIDIATAIRYPVDREKIHVIPQNYIVDGVSIGIQPPINQLGFKLEAQVHIVTASKTIIQNMKACMLRADYMLGGVMLKTLAQTQAVCHDDEMDLGSIIIDLGAGTTDVLVVLKGAPIKTCSIPVGGNLVTNDIAIVTKIPFAAAEEIKVASGCCWLQGITNDEDVILPGVGGRAPELIAKSQLCQIIQARMEQIFTFVRAEIIKNKDESIRKLFGNIILTGGGALMEGVVELAQAKFNTSSVRIGVPEVFGGNQDSYRRPDFATAIGLVAANKIKAQQNGKYKEKKSGNNPDAKKEGFLSRVRKYFF